MSRKPRNPNRAGFLNRVEDIRHMETDVDKLLADARLQRIESGKRPISPFLRTWGKLIYYIQERAAVMAACFFSVPSMVQV